MFDIMHIGLLNCTSGLAESILQNNYTSCVATVFEEFDSKLAHEAQVNLSILPATVEALVEEHSTQSD